jgi:long-chain acyl-CoA synthetase
MQRSLIETFFATARRLGGRIALRHREGGAWRERSWNDYAAEVRRVARGLIALGVPHGGTVAIVGPNRPEWLLANLGAMAAGGVPFGIYPTMTADQQVYIAGHAEAAVVPEV